MGNNNRTTNKLKGSTLFFIIIIFTVTQNQDKVMAQKNEFRSFDHQITLDSTKIKYIKKKQIFSFLMGNAANNFGYQKYEDGSVSSINCVKIIGNYAYLIDEKYNNLKRLNLIDGKMIVSDRNLVRNRTYLTSIGYINNTIYVFTTYDIVYLFDQELHYKKSVLLQNYRGDIYPYSENKDSLVVYKMDALTEGLFDIDHGLIKTTHTGIFNLIKIENNGKISNCKTKADHDMYDFLYGRENGSLGKEIPWKNKLLLNIYGVFYEMPYSFHNLNTYGCIDVDYTDKYVVCYKSSKAKLEVTICEY